VQTMLKYGGSEWTIVGLCFDYLASKKRINVFYLAEPCATDSGQSHWKLKHFQIWTNLKNIIQDLPEVYSVEDKEAVIQYMANSMFIPRFNLIDLFFRSTLVDLRIKKVYTTDVFNAYRGDLAKYGGFPPSVAYLIAKFPIPLFKLYFRFYDAVRVILRSFVHKAGPLNPNAKKQDAAR
jgi:hypothetical protein